MMAYIVPTEIPKCCAECPFRTPYEEQLVKIGLYRKISHCVFAPEEIDDIYRDIVWMCDNKEEWCPLKEMVSGDKVQWSKQGECPMTPEQFNAIYDDEMVGDDK